MTLPRQSDLSGRDLPRRLAQLRRELPTAGSSPSREALEGLLSLAADLGLGDDEAGDELAQIRAGLEGIEVKDRLDRGEIPLAHSIEPMAAGHVSYFACPVRFGRRRADQFGHLVLSSDWLKFSGALDVSVSWSEIDWVRRDGREVLVRLNNSPRVLRFSCHSYVEAARGGAIAEHLAQVAKADSGASSPCHASV